MEEMINVLPVLLFIVVAAVWLCTGLINSRLTKVFVTKLPDAAREHLPVAFVRGVRDPEKMLFFLRRSSDAILTQDSDVWSLTKRFRLFIKLTIAVPVVGFAIVGLATYLLSRQMQ